MVATLRKPYLCSCKYPKSAGNQRAVCLNKGEGGSVYKRERRRGVYFSYGKDKEKLDIGGMESYVLL
ncbi:hypothetical protein V490_06306 [Pseudogymnoascus sp. VKM F-3557]|nr:hypothetical protein V490_06306 [Pseudogymnoascus sp. VKM F-3557]